jgi:hypothetical protein
MVLIALTYDRERGRSGRRISRASARAGPFSATSCSALTSPRAGSLREMAEFQSRGF